MPKTSHTYTSDIPKTSEDPEVPTWDEDHHHIYEALVTMFPFWHDYDHTVGIYESRGLIKIDTASECTKFYKTTTSIQTEQGQYKLVVVNQTLGRGYPVKVERFVRPSGY